ncbi:glycine-rich RNA-binding protein 4 [Populus alba x Populus x berolinensis]|nr:glycine-rich RNA-binding protein 4 [Populus alba x Populus x berolinensis]
MAFLTKVGNMLRQTTSRQMASEISASRPSIYQAMRCMSSSKLFVGGISFQTDDNSLKEAFDKYDNVVEARIIMDRETGRSRGFGFVTYTSSEEASSAIQALDGQVICYFIVYLFNSLSFVQSFDRNYIHLLYHLLFHSLSFVLTSFCFKIFFSQDLHGRRVRVNYATERPQRTFNNNYGNYGGGNYGGGYGSGGGYGTNVGGNQGGRNATYGGNDGNYAIQNTFDGGAGNYGIAGGAGGNDSYAGTNADGGYDGNAGLGYGNSNQFGANNSSCGVFNPDDALDANYKDEDDAGDFAKRA